MRSIDWKMVAIGFLAVQALMGYSRAYISGVDTEREHAINAALRRRLDEQTPCDAAVRESRMLFDKMLKLRRESNETALRGYDNRESFDKQLTAGLY